MEKVKMATDAAIENTSHENQTGNNPVQTEASNTENPLVYDGKGGQIFQLWLMNFLLKIITLGIYSFWGKTRLRKYIYGSFFQPAHREYVRRPAGLWVTNSER